MRLETCVDRKEKSLALQLVQSFCQRKQKCLFRVDFFEMIHSCPHIGQHQVQYGQGCHAFYNHDCAGNDDRIVASLDLQRTFNMVTADGLLWLKDGWSWLDMSAQKDGRTVADAA